MTASGGFSAPNTNSPKMPRDNPIVFARQVTLNDLTSRMHLPLKPVADAGGWKDVTTLMRCYQHTDEARLLAAMTNQPTQRAAEGSGPVPA